MIENTIRKIKEGDLDDIIALRQRYLKRYNPEKELKVQKYIDFLASSIKGSDQLSFVIEVNGKIIGYVWCEIDEKSMKAVIHEFDIEKEFRGLGYGKALILETEKELEKRGVSDTSVTCREKDAQMILLFQSLGYHVKTKTLEKELGDPFIPDEIEEGDSIRF